MAGAPEAAVSAWWPRPLVAAVDTLNRRGGAVAVRLVKYTGKSREPIHPKHLVDTPWHHWYVDYLEADDVVLALDLPFPTLVLGGEVAVPTLEEEEKITVHRGTKSGSELRLRGRGFGRISANSRLRPSRSSRAAPPHASVPPAPPRGP